jgi:group I intron endonuclease
VDRVENKFTVYRIINSVNGLSYIGTTIVFPAIKRIQRHFNNTKPRNRSIIWEAIKKHGSSNFTVEILEECSSIIELDFLEKYYIKFYSTLIPCGYNILSGGRDNYRLPVEVRKIISDKNKKRQSPLKGRKFSDAHKLAMSKQRKGFTSENRINARINYHTRYKQQNLSNHFYAENQNTREVLLFFNCADASRVLKYSGDNIYRSLNGIQNRTACGDWIVYYKNKKINKKYPHSDLLTGIIRISTGGYSVKVLGKYVGYTKELKDAYLLRLSKYRELHNG